MPSGHLFRDLTHPICTVKLNLRAKTIFDKRALVVEHLAMTWNCIVEKPRESPVEVGLKAHEKQLARNGSVIATII